MTKFGFSALPFTTTVTDDTDTFFARSFDEKCGRLSILPFWDGTRRERKEHGVFASRHRGGFYTNAGPGLAPATFDTKID